MEQLLLQTTSMEMQFIRLQMIFAILSKGLNHTKRNKSSQTKKTKKQKRHKQDKRQTKQNKNKTKTKQKQIG